jgi:hypothetical protein
MAAPKIRGKKHNLIVSDSCSRIPQKQALLTEFSPLRSKIARAMQLD